jgi:hypothetical protein
VVGVTTTRRPPFRKISAARSTSGAALRPNFPARGL